MAKHPSTKLLLLLLLTIITITLSSLTPQASAAATGFRVELTRVPPDPRHRNLTKLQRLARRGQSGLLHRLSSAVDAPVRPGNGEFLMRLAIGTPPREFSAIMDTGSDLTWTQCLPCSDCFRQDTPIFDPANSSSFSPLPCSSPLCQSLPSSSCSSDRCDYLYAYGDYSSTQGHLATETFTFGPSSVPALAFGCGSDNDGDGFSQAAGLVGLGRGPLSLVSQLNQPKFSYCLTSIYDNDDKKTSALLMGSAAAMESNNRTAAALTTPLVKNPAQPSFYYLDLEGISVGGTRLGLEDGTFGVRDDGTGGMIIDSGTTITYLERRGFEALRDEFVRQTSLAVDESGSQGLDLCFSLPDKAVATVEVPKLVFHFRGADLDLPAENYILSDVDSGVVCLAMGSSTGMSIFGNVQQQNMLVVHDLEKETLSFVPTQCDQL